MNDFERIYRDWHEHAKNRDTEKLIALYADDAVLESPLVPAIMNRDSGILRGKSEILAFLEEGARRRPNELVRWYREDGRYFLRRRHPRVGIPAPNARRQPSGYPRTDAAFRRPHRPPPHLLGLVRHTNADCRPPPSKRRTKGRLKAKLQRS